MNDNGGIYTMVKIFSTIAEYCKDKLENYGAIIAAMVVAESENVDAGETTENGETFADACYFFVNGRSQHLQSLA